MKRRAFIRRGSLVLLAANATHLVADTPPALRIGLITDLHYADKPPRGSRHYRETLAKLEEAGTRFEKDRPTHLVELGDFIDAADSVSVEQGYLRRVQKQFTALPGRKHHVLGNHCVDTLTKEEFLGETDQSASYLSFDDAGFHFVILDACFRSDGTPYQRRNFEWTDANVPPAELEWLAADLQTTTKPTIVFAHQRLDGSDKHSVKNAAAVRNLFEESGRVKAVFQGHSHKNDHRLLNGIHYTTLVAMVEGSGETNNGYSLLNLHADGSIVLDGFRQQAARRF